MGAGQHKRMQACTAQFPHASPVVVELAGLAVGLAASVLRLHDNMESGPAWG